MLSLSLFLCLLLLLVLECNSQASYDFTDIVATGTFTIPSGIYEIDITLVGALRTLTFNMIVAPNDILSFDFDGQAICLETAASLYHNGNLVAVASDGSTGEGYDESTSSFKCNGVSWYQSNVLNPVVTTTTLQSLAGKVAYYSTCPEDYTHLLSDFNPILLPDSSLYNTNGDLSLKVNFRIPNYYYNVTASYGSQCLTEPTVTPSAYQCNTDFKTSIDYYNNCTFSLTNDTNDYTYGGILYINASLDFTVDTYTLTREVSSPLYWQVTLDREISVTSDVNITDSSVCYTNAECNNNGCCVNGVCDCTCLTSVGSGYTGTYCETDNTPPACNTTALCGKTHTIPSYHGGSIRPIQRGLIAYPFMEFHDNGGSFLAGVNVTVVSKTTSGHVLPQYNDLVIDDYIYDFPIGTTTVTYNVSDNSGNYAQFSYTVVVEDKSPPVVDCHDCQNVPLTTRICLGNTTGWTVLSIDSSASLDSYVSDSVIIARNATVAVYPTLLPGQDINFTDTFGPQVAFSGFLDCDCILRTNSESYEETIITKTWESWGVPTAIDPYDGSPLTAPTSYTDPLADGLYNVTYTATDVSGNTGTCTMINVLYDINPPECTDFYFNTTYDPLDTNESLPIRYYGMNDSYGISGKNAMTFSDVYEKGVVRFGGLVYPTDNMTFWVEHADNITYSSVVTLSDRAGNVKTCSWDVFIVGSGCVYPTCNDTYPVAHNCPTNIEYNCTSTSTGYGGWTNPTFTDDKFVQLISVYFNESLVEQYDNTQISTASISQLALGVTDVRYHAVDMHGQDVNCSFTVKYVDREEPPFVSCPVNDTIQLNGFNSSSYTYAVTAADVCLLNTQTSVNSLTFGYGTAETVSLTYGSYSFSMKASDDSGNINYCNWQVDVYDQVKPIITCPANITTRADQGTTSTVETYVVNAYDLETSIKNITYTGGLTNTAFTVGTHEISATAYDQADNFDNCTFYIEVLEAYPYGSFDVVLVNADISLNETTSNYEALLEFVTFTSQYHRLTVIPYGSSVANDNINIIRGPDETTGTTCGLTDVICQQQFKFNVDFGSCDVNGAAYDFYASIDCLPGDCLESTYTQDFTISIEAANYCWQDLASVVVSAEMITVPVATHDTYRTSYSSNPAATKPSHESVYYNGDQISGIVFVSSNQIETTGVTITSATKDHYNDNLYSSLNSTTNLVTSFDSTESKADWASFTYTETAVPLRTTFYTRYSATVSIDYKFNSTSTRRMLLEASSDQYEPFTKKVSAEVVTFAQKLEANSNISPDDAIAYFQLQSCEKHTSSWDSELETIISRYLRVSDSLVSINIAENDECLVQIVLHETHCGISLIAMLEELEEGVTDMFSLLHSQINLNEVITTNFDHQIFFVSQVPNQGSKSYSDYNDVTIAANVDLTLYLAGGFVIGILFTSFLVKCCCLAGAGKRNKDNEQKKN